MSTPSTILKPWFKRRSLWMTPDDDYFKNEIVDFSFHNICWDNWKLPHTFWKWMELFCAEDLSLRSFLEDSSKEFQSQSCYGHDPKWDLEITFNCATIKVQLIFFRVNLLTRDMITLVWENHFTHRFTIIARSKGDNHLQ